MKKYILLTLMLLVNLSVAFADNLIFEDITLLKTTPQEVKVSLTNDAGNIVGFQFDMELPTDVIPVTDASSNILIIASNRLGTSYSLRGKKQADGKYRFVYFTTSGSAISETSGEVFSFQLQQTTEDNCDEMATISNITLTTSGGEEITPANIQFKITRNASYIAKGTCGTSATWILTDDGLLSILGSGVLSDYTEEKTAPWYSYASRITRIELSDEITNIGNYDFWSLSNVTSVKMPNKLRSIGSYAFGGMSSLMKIDIPQSTVTIKGHAFNQCDVLKEVYISNWDKWFTISFGSTTANPLSNHADLFLNGEKVTELTFPNGLTEIKPDLFVGWNALTDVVIPRTITNIGEAPFSKCMNLSSIVVEDGNPRYNSNGNSNAIIETSTNTLIQGCKNTIIPNNIVIINNCACYGHDIESIVIPSTVTEIRNYAFSRCYQLKSIVCECVNPPTIYTSTLGSSYETANVYVKFGSVGLYKSADYWKRFANISTIQHNVTYIVDGNVYKVEQVGEGEFLTMPSAPVVEGQTFLRWLNVPETMPETDIIITAMLKPSIYNVYGKVTSLGTGVANVVVSDGYEVTTTNADGDYYLNSNKKNGYVFISLPSSYVMDENVYTSPEDKIFTPFYQLLSDKATAETPEEHNFSLRVENNDQHIMVIGADTHLANIFNDLNQFQQKFIPKLNDEKENAGTTPIYSTILGDLSFDGYWYSNNYDLQSFKNTLIADKYPLSLFPVMGNHDNNPGILASLTTDFEAAERYRSLIAPTYYSYNIGKVHYIVLDDIFYKNQDKGSKYATGVVGSRDYDNHIIQDELDWLRKDLSYIEDKTTPIIVEVHIPVWRLETTSPFNAYAYLTNHNSVNSSQKLCELLKDYDQVHIVSGHTHYNYHAHPSEYPNIHENNIAAVCANWWKTDGLSNRHICSDGSPGGYTVYYMNGKDISWQYHSMEENGNAQFRVIDMNGVKAYYNDPSNRISALMAYEKNSNSTSRIDYSTFEDNCLLVNVFNYDTDWTIEASENGEELTVERGAYEDPIHTLAYDLPAYIKDGKIEKVARSLMCSHIFKVKCNTPNGTVVIKVTDPFGNVSTRTFERPMAFMVNMQDGDDDYINSISNKVTYIADGKVIREDDIHPNALMTPPSAPEKPGYTFVRWEGLPQNMGNTDIKVKAVYSINEVTKRLGITFDANGPVLDGTEANSHTASAYNSTHTASLLNERTQEYIGSTSEDVSGYYKVAYDANDNLGKIFQTQATWELLFCLDSYEAKINSSSTYATTDICKIFSSQETGGWSLQACPQKGLFFEYVTSQDNGTTKTTNVTPYNSQTIQTGRYYHAVVTVDRISNKLRMYVNGKPICEEVNVSEDAFLYPKIGSVLREKDLMMYLGGDVSKQGDGEAQNSNRSKYVFANIYEGTMTVDQVASLYNNSGIKYYTEPMMPYNDLALDAVFGANGTVKDESLNAAEIKTKGRMNTQYNSAQCRYEINNESANNENFYYIDYFADPALCMPFGQAFSYEVYAKTSTGESSIMSPISAQQAGGFGFEVSTNGAIKFNYNTFGYRITDEGSHGMNVSTDSGTLNDKYTHYVCVADPFNGKTQIYINGSLVKETNDIYPTKYAFAKYSYAPYQWLVIGGDAKANLHTKSDYPWKGNISVARVWSKALTANDVSSLYDQATSSSTSVNIDASGWTTVCLPYAAIIPAGVKAFIVKEQNEDNVVLEKYAVENEVIPYGTPVILKGTEGEYTLSSADLSTATIKSVPETNLLRGSFIQKIAAEKEMCVLNGRSFDLASVTSILSAEQAWLPWNGKNSLNINYVEYHTITYMVDGEVYKVEKVGEGEQITPLAIPVKDGYAFSGWSTIPSIMGENDIVITGTFAPANTDINQYENVIYSNDVVTSRGSSVTLTIMMKNTFNATGYSFDLVAPVGIDLSTATATIIKDRKADNVSFSYAPQADGSLKVIAYTTDTPFSGHEGSICKIKFSIPEDMHIGEYVVKIRNIEIAEGAIAHNIQDVITSTLTVSSYLAGDANCDGTVSVSDLSAIVGYILNTRTIENFNAAAADANHDNNVSVSDLSTIVKIILYGSADAPSSAKSYKRKANSYSMRMSKETIAPGEEKQVYVRLANEGKVSGFQFDVALPAGLRCTKVSKKGTRTADGFSLSSSQVGSNVTRVVCYSADDKAVGGNDGDVLFLTIKADEEIESGEKEILLSDVEISNDGVAYELGSTSHKISIGQPTRIEGLQMDKNVKVYDLKGNRIDVMNTRRLPKGIYIINGKKARIN